MKTVKTMDVVKYWFGRTVGCAAGVIFVIDALFLIDKLIFKDE